MENKHAVAFILVALLLAGGCATRRSSKSSTDSYRLGDATVHVITTQHGPPSPTMINVHDDENTSVIAGKAIIKESSGRVVELSHSGRRFVVFNLDNQTFRFDPNRIFSDDGIRATLGRRGGNYSEPAHRVVKEFAEQFIARSRLESEPAIIALHNTGGGGLNINSYAAGGELNSSSVKVHVGNNRSAGDFFYVTDARFFDYLSARDFNVTLQDDAHVPDDGSLSVYFARKGIPYLNIEADVSHLEEQTRMVRTARTMLKELGLAAKSD